MSEIMSEHIYDGTMEYNLIYVFEIPDEAHKGYLKIGDHRFESSKSYRELPDDCDELNRQAKIRIGDYTRTALVDYRLLHTELARRSVRLDDGTIESKTFRDYDVHNVLDRTGFDLRKFHESGKPSEWYKINPKTAIAAIKAVKEGRAVLSAEEVRELLSDSREALPTPRDIPPITLRDEQKACVNKTKRVLDRGDQMLWDCKMRFGKTITAYALIKEAGYEKVIIVTHRPVVVDGWKTDFYKIFKDGRVFVSKKDLKKSASDSEYVGNDGEVTAQLENLSESRKPFVYFASMQDLRGSKRAAEKAGEKKEKRPDKNNAVFDMDWDLVIYDEAHEGTQTPLGKAVQELLEEPKEGKAPKKILKLSGTPYNIMNQYDESNTYKWDYVDEQEAKEKWEENHPGEPNPYGDLPRLKIYTFDLRNNLSHSYRYETETVAFNFREFFRVWTGDKKQDFAPMPEGAHIGDFVHAEDVRAFLDIISSDSASSNYPFSKPEYRDLFRHTFWIVPGVKEARALSNLLRRHPVFGSYEIVNVAGEGDVEKPYDDALKEVRSAINKHDRTITLSCGKLTTGVTVGEWTGVMLLAGSANTGAMEYMQTVFRVQSAGSIDGKQKSVCYAFDFAPDRALRVLSEVHKLKKSAVGTDDNGRIALGKFLNFCPVLAETDSGMSRYDVPQMMKQIKRISIEAAIKSGFDDDSIYKADAGIVVDREKLRIMDIMVKRLTPQKHQKRVRKIIVNRQGMSAEEYEKAQNAKRTPKRERTPEEKEALEKEKELRKKQRALFDLLRGVSIRLPLLIFGTAEDFDEAVRLEDFVDIVDDESWKVFMPEGLSKDLFKKLLTFYDEDVIAAAGSRIRHMAKAADELMPTRRVMKIAELFSYFRNPTKETVLTPWRVVNMHMGDTIGGYNFYEEGYPEEGILEEPRFIDNGNVTRDLFRKEDVRILEMNSKSGLYPLYVAYSIYRMIIPKSEDEMSLEEARAWWGRALENRLFVLCQTKMAVSVTKRTLAGYTDTPVNAVYLTRLLDRMDNQERLARKITNPITWNKEGERMNFGAIVGNPPYHQSDGGNAASAVPIYQKFVEQAKEINPQYISMIIESRWMTGGRGLEDFRSKMLQDTSIMVLHDFPDSTYCFYSVEIKGGICYFLWNDDYTGKCSIYRHLPDGVRFSKRYLLEEGDSIFVREERLLPIKDKVNITDNTSFETIVSSMKPYGLRGDVFKDPSKYNLPAMDEESIPGRKEYKILGLSDLKRTWRYVDVNYPIPTVSPCLEKWKVFIARNWGVGSLDDVPSKPVIASPGELCTETFIEIGPFDTQQEAENVISYIRTKFFRALVAIRKQDQGGSKAIYHYVPLQDFSKPWTDEELYKKYNLTDEEIAFIESMIKPMSASELAS